MWVCWICLLVIIVGCLGARRGLRENVTVTTPVGDITGIAGVVEFDGEIKEVSTFLGIPYAEPPVGERRFAKPVILRQLSSPYEATHHKPHCPQNSNRNAVVKNFRVSEDCLHLNVYIPGRRINLNRRYTVMVWIYGGAFAFGGADIYSGEVLSAVTDVVVVTFNYRMNVFGFLRSEDGSVPGNLGLWDQHAVIQWVHENIASFGGDPDKVTLFGESAGAASAVYQSMYRGNKGLVRRIIAQSGSPLAVWALQTSPQTNYDTIMNRTQCYNDDQESALECLRRKPYTDILPHVLSLDTFFPAVDGEFITDTPDRIFDGKTDAAKEAMALFSGVDFMSGVNNKDGAAAVTNYWAKFLSKMGMLIENGVPKFFFENVYVPTTLRTLYKDISPSLTASVLHAYTNWSSPQDGLRIRDNMVDMSSDVYFFVPAIQAANTHFSISKNKSTFFYEFVHKPALASKPPWLEGATHTMEIPYVFGLPSSMKAVLGLPADHNVVIPDDEIRLSRRMMVMWSSFAKTGNPNSRASTELGLPTWPEYDTGNQSYLQLSTAISTSSVKRHLAADRIAFWTNVVPELRRCSPSDARDDVKPVIKDNYEISDNEDSGGHTINVSITCCIVIAICHAVRGL